MHIGRSRYIRSNIEPPLLTSARRCAIVISAKEMIRVIYQFGITVQYSACQAIIMRLQPEKKRMSGRTPQRRANAVDVTCVHAYFYRHLPVLLGISAPDALNVVDVEVCRSRDNRSLPCLYRSIERWVAYRCVVVCVLTRFAIEPTIRDATLLCRGSLCRNVDVRKEGKYDGM